MLWCGVGVIVASVVVLYQDQLGQDVFLIGPPGPLRRNVAMMYLVCFLSHF